MLFKKLGFPKESELVLCTVTKIHHHSVFVRLDWYDKSGMLHISEISPGRIRNIREYVEEGKQIVCKVLSVNSEKGHIDISLRRVTQFQKTELLEALKQEMKAEKILEVFCKEQKLDLAKTYEMMLPKFTEHFSFLHAAFKAFLAGEFQLAELGLTSEQATSLDTLIRSRIKPPQVEILGNIKINAFSGDGVEKINSTFQQAIATNTKELSIAYAGGGHYNVRVICGDFKQAEKILKDALDIVESSFKDSKDCIYEFTRSEGKQIE